MNSEHIGLLLAACATAAGMLAPVRSQPSVQALEPAIAAVAFLKQDASTRLFQVARDSVVVDIAPALAEADSAEIDSLASRVEMRLAVRPFHSCNRTEGSQGRAARAGCALAQVKYYVEFAEFDLRADSGWVTVAVYGDPQGVQRRMNLVRKMGSIIAGAFLTHRRGPPVSLVTYTVRLSRQAGRWTATGLLAP